MADIDHLSIEITASSKEAKSAIDDLIKSIRQLNSALDFKIPTQNLTSFVKELSIPASGLKDLTKGIRGMNRETRTMLDSAKGASKLSGSFSEITNGAKRVSPIIEGLSKGMGSLPDITDDMIGRLKILAKEFNGSFGIKSRESVIATAEQIGKLYKSLDAFAWDIAQAKAKGQSVDKQPLLDDIQEQVNGLRALTKELGRVKSEFAYEYQDIYKFIRSRAGQGKISLGKASDYDDIGRKEVLKTLGNGFRFGDSVGGAGDVAEFARSMNEALHTTINLDTSLEDVGRQVYQLCKDAAEASKVMNWGDAARKSLVDARDLGDAIRYIVEQMRELSATDYKQGAFERIRQEAKQLRIMQESQIQYLMDFNKNADFAFLKDIKLDFASQMLKALRPMGQIAEKAREIPATVNSAFKSIPDNLEKIAFLKDIRGDFFSGLMKSLRPQIVERFADSFEKIRIAAESSCKGAAYSVQGLTARIAEALRVSERQLDGFRYSPKLFDFEFSQKDLEGFYGDAGYTEQFRRIAQEILIAKRELAKFSIQASNLENIMNATGLTESAKEIADAMDLIDRSVDGTIQDIRVLEKDLDILLRKGMSRLPVTDKGDYGKDYVSGIDAAADATKTTEQAVADIMKQFTLTREELQGIIDDTDKFVKSIRNAALELRDLLPNIREGLTQNSGQITKEIAAEIKKANTLQKRITSARESGDDVYKSWKNREAKVESFRQRIVDGNAKTASGSSESSAGFKSAKADMDAAADSARRFRGETDKAGGTFRNLKDIISNVSSTLSGTFGNIASRIKAAFGDIGKKIKESLDVRFAMNGFEKLIGSAEGLARVINSRKYTASFRGLAQNLRDISSKVEELRAKGRELLVALSNAETPQRFRELQEEIVQTGAELRAAEKQAENFENRMRRMHEIGSDVRSISSRLREIQMVTRAITEPMNRMGNTLFGVLKGIYSGAASAARGIAKLSFAPFIASARAAGVVVSGLKKAMSSFALSAGNAIKSVVKRFKRVTQMLRLMIIRRAIYAILREINSAVESLARYSDMIGTRFNDSLSNIIADAKWIARSIVGAFEPIVNAVAPILDFLAAKITYVMGLVGQFFAAMTGQGYYMKAKKNVQNYAKSLDNASKEQKKFLLGIDELNIVPDNSSASAVVPNPADEWDKEPISDKVKEFADKVKDILSKLFDPLKKAWDIAGDYVKEGFRHMVDSLKKLFKDIGRDFLAVWNQPETVAMLAELMEVLGDIFHIIGYIADAFRKAWNHNKIGRKILMEIRDILATIIHHIHIATQDTIEWAKHLDFYPLLKSFAYMLRKIRIALDKVLTTLNLIYRDIVLPMLKWAIEKGLPTVERIIGKIAEGVGNLADNLNKAWVKLDFGKKLAKSLTDIFDILLQHITNVANSFVNWSKGVNFEPLLDTFNQLVESLKPFADFIGGVFEDIMEDAVMPFVQYLIEDALPKINTAVKRFMDAVDWESLREHLDKVWKAAGHLAEALVGGLADAIDNIGQSVAKFVNSDEFKTFLDNIANFLNQIDQEMVSKIFTALGEAILDIVKAVVGFVNSEGFQNFLQGIIDYFKNASVDDIKNKIKALATAIALFKFGAFVGKGVSNFLQLLSALPVVAGLGKIVLEAVLVIGAIELGSKGGSWLGKKLTGEDDLYDNFKWTGEGGFIDQMTPTNADKKTLTQNLKEVWDDSINGAAGMLNSENPFIKALSNSLAMHALQIPGLNMVAGAALGTAERKRDEELFQRQVEAMKPVAEETTKTIGKLKEVWNEFWGSMSGKRQTWDGLEEGKKSADETATAVNSLGEKIKEVFTGTKVYAAELNTGVSSNTAQMGDNASANIEKIGTASEQAKSKSGTAFGELKKNVTDALSTAWQGVQAVWNGAPGWFDANVSTPVSNTFSQLLTNVQGIWGTASGWFDANVIQPVVGFFGQLWANVSNGFSQLWIGIQGVWGTVSSWFNATIVLPVTAFFRQLGTNVLNTFTQLWTGIQGVWIAVSGWFDTAVITPVKTAFTDATTFVSGAFDTLWEGLKSGVKTCFNSVIGVIENAINGIIDGINGFVKGLNLVIEGAGELAGKDWNGIELVPEVKLPRFSAGGFPEDGLFMANHTELVGKFSNGKTAVANNEQILSGIQSAVQNGMAQALMNYGSSGSGDITVKLEVDGQTLYETVARHSRREIMRTGNSSLLGLA